jgi:hypothetical protein
MYERRDACWVLMVKSKGSDYLEYLGVDGRIILYVS